MKGGKFYEQLRDY